MQTKRDRLAIRIFRVIEWQSEGPLAILVFLVSALAATCLAVWSIGL
jgi:hypothetical protein